MQTIEELIEQRDRAEAALKELSLLYKEFQGQRESALQSQAVLQRVHDIAEAALVGINIAWLSANIIKSLENQVAMGSAVNRRLERSCEAYRDIAIDLENGMRQEHQVNGPDYDDLTVDAEAVAEQHKFRMEKK